MSKEMKLCIDGDTFKDMKTDINNYLQTTFAAMVSKDVTEAEITIKLTIKLEETTLPVLDKKDEISHRDVLLPTIKHKLSSIMKTKLETGGELFLDGNYELTNSIGSGEYILRKISDPQQTLYDVG